MQFGFIKWEPRDFQWEPPWEPFFLKITWQVDFLLESAVNIHNAARCCRICLKQKNPT